MRPVTTVLAISGLDNSVGAGLSADCQAIGSNGCHPVVALTCSTCQCDQGVHEILPNSARHLASQLRCAFDHFTISAVKIGLLPNEDIATTVTDFLAAYPTVPVVLDPVLTATAGSFGNDKLRLVHLRNRILPLATVITPNSAEAGRLLGVPEPKTRQAIETAGEQLRDLGPSAVLVTGGHGGENDTITDCLVDESGASWHKNPRLPGTVRGTGCTLAATLASMLAKGMDLHHATANAIIYTQSQIARAWQIPGQENRRLLLGDHIGPP